MAELEKILEEVPPDFLPQFEEAAREMMSAFKESAAGGTEAKEGGGAAKGEEETGGCGSAGHVHTDACGREAKRRKKSDKNDPFQQMKDIQHWLRLKVPAEAVMPTENIIFGHQGTDFADYTPQNTQSVGMCVSRSAHALMNMHHAHTKTIAAA